jgi:hypothetical protein
MTTCNKNAAVGCPNDGIVKGLLGLFPGKKNNDAEDQ